MPAYIAKRLHTHMVLTAALLACPGYCCAQGVIDTPIVHWPFDEQSGDAVNQGTLGAAADATATNVTPTGQLIGSGGAYQFNGNGRVTPGTVAGLTSSGPWDKRTVSLWFRADTVSGRQVLFGEGGTTREFVIYLQDGFLYAAAENRANDDGGAAAAPWGKPPVFIVSSQSIAPGRVYHVVAMLDGNFTNLSGELRGYLDGELFASTTGIGGLWNHNPAYVGRSSTLRFHDNTTGSNNFFTGAIDDVKVWNSAPTAQEIREEYLLGLGLVGHWKLDEASGTTASDSSGLGVTLTHEGSPAWTTDAVRGRSVGGDAANEFSANRPFDRITDGVSVACWFKMNQAATSTQSLVDYGSVADGEGFTLSVDSAGDLRFRLNDSGGGGTASTGISGLGTGVWRQAVATYDGATVRLYLDGDLVGSSAYSGPITPFDGDFRLAAGLDGAIDDVMVYNRAMTDKEIAEHHGLVGHWRLDESSGAVAADASGLGNDLTASTAPAWTGNAIRSGAAVFAGYDSLSAASGVYESIDEAFSVAFWFNSDAAVTDLTADSNLIQSLSGGEGFHLVFASGTDELLLTKTNSGVDGAVGVDGAGLNAGDWHQAVVLYDGSQLRLYLDGELGATQPDANGLSALAGPLQLANSFLGKIDDLKLYNRAMTEQEIGEHYGLLAHWELDEESGVTLADSTVFGNDATFSTGAPTWVAGKVDGGLHFGGGSDAATDSVFDPPAVGSVAFWFKPDNNLTTGQRLFGLGDDWEVRSDAFGYLIADLGGVGLLNFETNLYANAAGQWHHIVANYDADNDQYELYGDGVLLVSGALTLSDQAAATLSFGTRTGSAERFTGTLDDVRVYNRWLTPDEATHILQGASHGGLRIVRWVEVR